MSALLIFISFLLIIQIHCDKPVDLLELENNGSRREIDGSGIFILNSTNDDNSSGLENNGSRREIDGSGIFIEPPKREIDGSGIFILNSQDDGSGSGIDGSGESLLEGSGDMGQIENMMASGEEPEYNRTRFLDPSTHTHFAPLNISLEDFVHVDLSETDQLSNLTELAIEFRLFKHANESLDELTRLYSHAMGNLKATAPELKILHPIGGHFYFPGNGTIDQLRSELEFVHNGIDTLTSLMHAFNWTLADDKFDYIKYSLYVVFDEEASNDTQYYQLLNETFGPEPMQLVNQKLPTNTVSLFYTANDISIKLDIVKYTDPAAILDKGLESDKRVDYKIAVPKLSELDQTSIAVPKLKEQIVEMLS